MATPLGSQHHSRSRDEGTQVQCLVIEDALALRVRRVVELESPIEPEAVDDVGAHATAHGIGCLEHGDGHAEGLQLSRGSKAAHTCTHDDHGHGAHASRLWITESTRPPRAGTMPT